MSRRTSITRALVEKFKLIDGTYPYKSNIFNNAYSKLEFWDQVQDFPSVFAVSGAEAREYLPGNFTWGYLGISLKVYCKGENSDQMLEDLLEDIETVVDANRVLLYDVENNYETTEILITSITTDEGLLYPYAIGEMNLQVRYALQ